MPYTQEATLRSYYKRLRKFLKLLDYIIISSKTKIVLNGIQNMIEQISLKNSFDYSDTYNKVFWIKVEVN